jgi:hypothetical protein
MMLVSLPRLPLHAAEVEPTESLLPGAFDQGRQISVSCRDAELRCEDFREVVVLKSV